MINSFATRSCSHKGTSAAMCFLAIEQMVALMAAAYLRVSKASLKKTFLLDCYREDSYVSESLGESLVEFHVEVV